MRKFLKAHLATTIAFAIEIIILGIGLVRHDVFTVVIMAPVLFIIGCVLDKDAEEQYPESEHEDE